MFIRMRMRMEPMVVVEEEVQMQMQMRGMSILFCRRHRGERSRLGERLRNNNRDRRRGRDANRIIVLEAGGAHPPVQGIELVSGVAVLAVEAGVETTEGIGIDTVLPRTIIRMKVPKTPTGVKGEVEGVEVAEVRAVAGMTVVE